MGLGRDKITKTRMNRICNTELTNTTTRITTLPENRCKISSSIAMSGSSKCSNRKRSISSTRTIIWINSH